MERVALLNLNVPNAKMDLFSQRLKCAVFGHKWYIAEPPRKGPEYTWVIFHIKLWSVKTKWCCAECDKIIYTLRKRTFKITYISEYMEIKYPPFCLWLSDLSSDKGGDMFHCDVTEIDKPFYHDNSKADKVASF